MDLNADVFFHTRAVLPLAGEDAQLFAVAEVMHPRLINTRAFPVSLS